MISAGQLFAFSLGSGIVLLALYLVYKWIMADENQHIYNRVILLAIYAVSLVALPLISLIAGIHAVSEMSVAASGDFTITALPVNAGMQPDNTIMRAVVWIYLVGIGAVTAHTLMIIARLITIIYRGERRSHGHFTLVIVDRPTRLAPFSWGRYMVMSRNDYESAGDLIAAHESQHLRSMHWIDLLAAQIIAVICWYNPAAWLMREELKAVHEYEADRSVLRSGADARQYQLLLVKKAVGARFPSLANSLNHSKLKKRITMMNSQKTATARRLRSLALVPALAAALCVTQLPAVAGVIEDGRSLSLTPDGKVSENVSAVQEQPAPVLIIRNDDAAAPVAQSPDASAAGEATAENPAVTAAAETDDTRSADSEPPFGNDTEVYINGTKSTYESLNEIDPSMIESINVRKDTDPARIEVTLKAAGTPAPTFRMTQLNNIKGTNVEIIVENINSLSVSEAKLINGNDVYPAKSMSMSMSDATAHISIRFKELHTFHDNTAVVLQTNLGEIRVSAPHSVSK